MLFILSEGNFFNNSLLSGYIVYRIHFQNENITSYTFLLVLKIVESVSLNQQYTKIQLSQKYYRKSIILKIIVFLADIGYLVKLVTNH